jgi:DNA replication protein DnaC
MTRTKTPSPSASLHEQTVRHHCRALKMPTVAGQFETLAQAAIREGHVQYLDALLTAEIEERERKGVVRRIQEARLPRVKTLAEFDFKQSSVSAARIADLAAGGYIGRAEPVVLIGEAGTGKTHLALGLCVAACQQRRRVRFTSAAALVNELVEAASQLSRVLGRWERVDLICIDEVGYVPLMEMGAELMFQVIADRAEKTALIVTTNLPFSEWGQVFPNPRLCGAVLDRVTDQAHIIETGGESYRFKRSMAKRGAAP